jgi:general secretion pathway protein N
MPFLRWWWLVAIGIAAYAVALIATAPATLVDANLQRASNGRLRLAEAHGTVWSGAGRIEIREAGGRTGVGRSVTWRVVPESLVRGRLLCEVRLEEAAGRIPVRLSFSRIELWNAEVSLPAAVLGLAEAKLAPLGLTGEVLIQAREVAFAKDEMRGSAILRWRAAGSALTPLSPLGEYELRLDGTGAVVHVALSTVSGPLQLDGKGSWKHGDSVAFQGTARVSPEHRQQLVPLLRLIAVENGKGVFDLQLK